MSTLQRLLGRVLISASVASSVIATSTLAEPPQSRSSNGPRLVAMQNFTLKCRGSYNQNNGVSFSYDGIRPAGNQATATWNSNGTTATIDVRLMRRGGNDMTFRVSGPAPGNYGAETIVLVDDRQFRSQEAFNVSRQDGTFASARFNYVNGQPTLGSFRMEERRNGSSMRVVVLNTCWGNMGHDPDPSWRGFSWNPNITVHPSLLRPPSPYAVSRQDVIGENGNSQPQRPR
ncbi:hypothetical protein [Brevundimonas sp.]|uniref:hypothetical protein n=1 Tax=Brevundimonas sp. TaxID=1871086 RepID=UPI00261AEAC5|nr:hypothetical protein [Brevundimonas sp.]